MTNLLLVLNKPNSTKMTPAKFMDDKASPLVKDITDHKRLVATRPILLGAFFFIQVYTSRVVIGHSPFDGERMREHRREGNGWY